MKTLVAVIILTIAAAAQQPGDPRTQMPPDKPAPPPVEKAPQDLPKATSPTSPPATHSADDPGAQKARALLDKMVQALGGQAYLTMQTMEYSGRTYGFHRGEPSGTGAPFWTFWKWPDKERTELLKKREWKIIHNGDKGWEITFHGTSPEEKEALADHLRRRYYSLQNVLREWLKEPGIAYFYEGIASAERKPAEQITIMNARNEALTIYIDQNTFLPIKKTFQWRDPETRDRNDESEIYDNYRNVQGIMTPFSVTRQRNGLNTNQRFINNVVYNRPLADSLFQVDVAANAK